jgi:PBSX family phage terminase large subunit
MISAQQEIIVKRLPQFDVLYNPPEDTSVIILIGGRGGAKTYEGSKYVAVQSTIRRKRCAILRDEKSLIRESILNEVLLRYDTADENGRLSALYERLDTGIKDKRTGEMFVFTKGFRASSGGKKANLKSISNVDVAVIEEAEDIRDEDSFNTFADSIRKNGALIIIILNTPDINHWIVKRYFNLERTEHDGYWKIIPKKIKGFVCIQTNYDNNPYLPETIVESYRSYGDVNSHKYNLHYYLTAILGYASSGRKGQVLHKAKPITLDEYLALDLEERFGIDFGTSSPAGVVGAKFDGNNIYARELLYKPSTTLEIAKHLCTLGFTDKEIFIADSADAQAVLKLRRGWEAAELDADDLQYYPQLLKGFNVYGAAKGDGSIKYGVDQLNSKNLFIVEESVNFWNEVYNYIYAVDRNKNPTDMPIDGFNHLIDPLRYVDSGRGVFF